MAELPRLLQPIMHAAEKNQIKWIRQRRIPLHPNDSGPKLSRLTCELINMILLKKAELCVVRRGKMLIYISKLSFCRSSRLDFDHFEQNLTFFSRI